MTVAGRFGFADLEPGDVPVGGPRDLGEQPIAVVDAEGVVGGFDHDRQAGMNQAVGALTLVMFPIPTGVRAWIEDVVVDEAVQGGALGPP